MAAETGMTNTGADRPEELEEQIEETRAEMSETLDAIQRKLDPDRLKEQAVETVKDAAEQAKEQVIQTAREATQSAMDTAHDQTIGRAETIAHEAQDTAMEVGNSMMDLITRNPVPTALAAAGLGWLLLENQGGTERRPQYAARKSRDGAYRREYATRGEERGFWHGTRDFEEDQGFMENLSERVPVGPLPAALAALGLGWLFMEGRGRQPSRSRRRYRSGVGTYQREREWDREYVGEARARAGRASREAQERAGEMWDRAEDLGQEVQDRATQLADEARHATRDVQDRATDLVDEARERAERVTDEARERASEMRSYIQPSRLEQMMEDNPLAVGAIALAFGAAIGAAIPETRYEDEVFGPTREELMQQARERADETLQEAQTRAQDTIEKVQRVAEESAKAARVELENQLAGSATKGATQQSGEALRSAAREATQTAKEEAKSEELTEGGVTDTVKKAGRIVSDAATSARLEMEDQMAKGASKGVAEDAGDAIRAAAEEARKTAEEEAKAQGLIDKDKDKA
ncbi:MAG: DUF3618 domain-containing protein [Chloroflexota bacterium]|nr:DUF3618 domain-containing protein [Chloroflexota bacterium]